MSDKTPTPSPTSPRSQSESERVRWAVGHGLKELRSADGYTVRLDHVRVDSAQNGFRVQADMTGDVGQNPSGEKPSHWEDDGWGTRVKTLDLPWTPDEGDPRAWILKRAAATELRPDSTEWC